jgi:hypothetical protein
MRPTRRAMSAAVVERPEPGHHVRAPTLLWLLTAAGLVGVFLLWLPYASFGGTELSLMLLPPVLLVYASLGWLILRHRPGHLVGWMMMLGGPLGIVFAGGIGLAAPLAEANGPDDALAGALLTLGIASLVPMFVIVIGMIPVLYPDGRLPGPGWRWPVGATLLATITTTVLFLLAPQADQATVARNPFSPPGMPDALTSLAGVLGVTTALMVGALAVASVVVRFRRGRGAERQQLKWMLAPVALVVGLNLPTFLGAQIDNLLSVVQVMVMLLIPVAITTAILRYRLYEIDRLISRTIAYSVVLALLVTLFGLGNLVLQAVLEGITQGDTLAVAGSTLIAFAAAQPLWRRVRRLVDLRFDRARIDAARTAAAFSDRQRDRVDLEAVVNDVRATANDSLRPASVGVWLRGDGA